MALAGRKPKPVALHVINGNPSKLDLEKKVSETPKFKPIAPKCSPRLSKGAKKEWKRIAPELERLGLLTNADKAIFEMYCQVYSECIDLEKFIKDNGTTYKYVKRNKFNQVVSEYEMQYPQVSQLDKKRTLLIKVCAEFGLTPSSRGRMSLPNDDPDDELDSLCD